MPSSPGDTASIGAVEAPTNLTVVVETRNITGGTTGAVMVMSCDPPVYRSDLTVKFEYQVDGEDRWSVVSQGTQTYETETAILPDGTYNVRASFYTPSNVQSAFDTVLGVIVAVTSAAPGTPIGFTAILQTAGAVYLSATAANSPQMYAGRFYRNAVNNYATASDITGQIFAGANQFFDYLDTPTSGTWYYWTSAENSAGTKSSPAGPQTVTV